ncbi:hypothetical protein GOBAR_DD34342 [Gossypium barbadense]|nr:hypothetical protein GOBAR_DD34342 [Gossypium barbadense]
MNNLNFQYGSWLRAQLEGLTQNRGNWRNGIEILEKKIILSEENKSNKTGNGMSGCLAISSEGRCRGLVILWKDGIDVSIQNYSSHHMDSPVRMESHNNIRKDWIVGGDFNAIINEVQKEESHTKSKVTMDEFRDVIEELTLVDIKTDKGWFTWLRRENEAKDIIKKVWSSNDTNIIEKLAKVRYELGPWQHGRYRTMKNHIGKLVARIDKLINGPYEEFNADMLKTARLKLGHLYAE